jgi:hypothetical protein
MTRSGASTLQSIQGPHYSFTSTLLKIPGLEGALKEQKRISRDFRKKGNILSDLMNKKTHVGGRVNLLISGHLSESA